MGKDTGRLVYQNPESGQGQKELIYPLDESQQPALTHGGQRIKHSNTKTQKHKNITLKRVTNKRLADSPLHPGQSRGQKLEELPME